MNVAVDKGVKKMGKRILVVDDSIFIHEEIKRYLAGSDYEVAEWVKTGEHALEIYDEVKPDFVTMDVIMAGADGIDITRELVQKWPDAKVIVVTSLAYPETETEAMVAGAIAVLYKPFTKEGLLEILNQNCE